MSHVVLQACAMKQDNLSLWQLTSLSPWAQDPVNQLFGIFYDLNRDADFECALFAAAENCNVSDTIVMSQLKPSSKPLWSFFLSIHINSWTLHLKLKSANQLVL